MKNFGQIGLVFGLYKVKNIGGVENSIASCIQEKSKEDYKRDICIPEKSILDMIFPDLSNMLFKIKKRENE